MKRYRDTESIKSFSTPARSSSWLSSSPRAPRRSDTSRRRRTADPGPSPRTRHPEHVTRGMKTRVTRDITTRVTRDRLTSMPYWSLAAVLKMLSATQGKQQEIRHQPQPSLPGHHHHHHDIMMTILLTHLQPRHCCRSCRVRSSKPDDKG